jgi:folate-dependent tRNA-U54 methylase TrmFO/GidA
MTSVPKPATLRQSEAREEFESYAEQVLVREMKRKKVTYAELSARLAELGIRETPGSLNRKVNRKRFQAGFLLACLKALGVEVLDIRGLDASPAGRAARLARERLEEGRRAMRRREPQRPQTEE